MTRGFRPPRDLAERFWEKVDRSGECWLWTARRLPTGYGEFMVGSRTDGTRRLVRAHCFAYELAIGPIPDGYVIHHVCETPACVRPDHLEALTHREHVLRHDGPTAVNARKTHCPKCGLPLSGDNLLFETGRRCRACRYASLNARKRQLRAEAKALAERGVK